MIHALALTLIVFAYVTVWTAVMVAIADIKHRK